MTCWQPSGEQRLRTGNITWTRSGAYTNILEHGELRTGQYRVHFDPFSVRMVLSFPPEFKSENDLFKLSRSYLGEG